MSRKKSNRVLDGIWCYQKRCPARAGHVAFMGPCTMILLCDRHLQHFKRFYGGSTTRVSRHWKPPTGWKQLVKGGRLIGAVDDRDLEGGLYAEK